MLASHAVSYDRLTDAYHRYGTNPTAARMSRATAKQKRIADCHRDRIVETIATTAQERNVNLRPDASLLLAVLLDQLVLRAIQFGGDEAAATSVLQNLKADLS